VPYARISIGRRGRDFYWEGELTPKQLVQLSVEIYWTFFKQPQITQVDEWQRARLADWQREVNELRAGWRRAVAH
jgi:hypothetical protein